ncbi:hypothetical protein NLM59_05850 [Weeksellaceae bacterium KMM 9724]|uniref:hypothetical protein n=1 Tax=Profundicola chukchiensis TaxID=2961959 RepID=UPI002437DB05|nr:hypothetical protein [Profundicola chukchiensis]MDG4950438.1 hypothetical protein [Profundicola chukchiensis]
MNSGNKKDLFFGFSSAFFYLFLVGILGLLMRSSEWIMLPLPFKNILHAHSHTALLGWAFVMVITGILNYFPLKWKALKAIKIAFSISIIGMFISFLYQSYGAISITFSTMFVLLAYILLKKLLNEIPKEGFDNTFLRRGIIYFYFSTVGIWLLGPTSAILGKSHWLYDAGIQFFLHFQINGFLLYAALGLIFKQIPKEYHPKDWATHFLDTGLLLGTALIAFWVSNNLFFYLINLISIICLFIGFIPVIQSIRKFVKNSKPKNAWILSCIMLGLVGKLIGHLINLNYDFTEALRFNRELVIAYMHLILIGVVSLGLIWNALSLFSWKLDKLFKVGIITFATGFYITEIILVLQGFRIAGLNATSSILWLFSAIMLLGILVMLGSFILLSRKNLGYK